MWASFAVSVAVLAVAALPSTSPWENILIDGKGPKIAIAWLSLMVSDLGRHGSSGLETLPMPNGQNVFYFIV